jgi:thymidylate kinase
MSAYLITGVSGSGKTTIAAALSKLGSTAIDMSSIKGLSSWIDSSGVSCKRPPHTTTEWFEVHRWVWNLEALEKLLKEGETSGPLFLCGNANNMADAYHLFDRIYYLKIEEPIILQRLQSSSRLSDFGRSDAERRQVIEWIETLDTRMAHASAITIDGNQPINNVVDSILRSIKASDHDHHS